MDVACDEQVKGEYLSPEAMLEVPQVVDADALDVKAAAQEGNDGFHPLSQVSAELLQPGMKAQFLGPVLVHALGPRPTMWWPSLASNLQPTRSKKPLSTDQNHH